MKFPKTAAIVLITTIFSSGLSVLSSQAQTKSHHTLERSNTSIISESLTPIGTKQNLKERRAPMDDILGLTNEQVIKKNALFLQFSNEINAVRTELADGISNQRTRDATLAIASERKTAISKKLFAEVRGILTPKQLRSEKSQKFLALYEDFLLKLAQTP